MQSNMTLDACDRLIAIREASLKKYKASGAKIVHDHENEREYWRYIIGDSTAQAMLENALMQKEITLLREELRAYKESETAANNLMLKALAEVLLLVTKNSLK